MLLGKESINSKKFNKGVKNFTQAKLMQNSKSSNFNRGRKDFTKTKLMQNSKSSNFNRGRKDFTKTKLMQNPKSSNFNRGRKDFTKTKLMQNSKNFTFSIGGKIFTKAQLINSLKKCNLTDIPRGSGWAQLISKCKKFYANRGGRVKVSSERFNKTNTVDNGKLPIEASSETEIVLDKRTLLNEMSKIFNKTVFFSPIKRNTKLTSLFRDTETDAQFMKLLKLSAHWKNRPQRPSNNKFGLSKLNDFIYLLPLADLPYI
jgi:hypothetical protein